MHSEHFSMDRVIFPRCAEATYTHNRQDGDLIASSRRAIIESCALIVKVGQIHVRARMGARWKGHRSEGTAATDGRLDPRGIARWPLLTKDVGNESATLALRRGVCR